MSYNNFEKISDIEAEKESEYLPDKEYLLDPKSTKVNASEKDIRFISEKKKIQNNPSKNLNYNNDICAENKVYKIKNIYDEDANNIKERIREFDNNHGIKREKKKDRLVCLDIFRGVTLFYMVVVNSNLDDTIYWFFTESDWNGLTPADCIFPSFLFIMGVAILLSAPNVSEDKCSKFLHILKRSSILFLLGLFFNAQKINFTHFENIRYMGVLQRLGVAYFLASLLHLLFDEFFFFKQTSNSNLRNKKKADLMLKITKMNKSAFSHSSSVTSKASMKYLLFLDYGLILQIFVVFIFLLAYTLFAYCFNVPDCGKGKIEKICFTGSYLDRKILGDKHIWVQNEYDPEGLVSTLSSVYPVFVGYFYGKFLRYFKNKKKDIAEIQRYLSECNVRDDYFNHNNSGKSQEEKNNRRTEENGRYNTDGIIEESKEFPKNGVDVRYISNENESKMKIKDNKDNSNNNNNNYYSNEYQPKMKLLIDEQIESELNFENEIRRMDFHLLYFWIVITFLNLSFGLILRYCIDIPFNKKAYTLSFAFLVSGISGFFLCLFYTILDLIKNDRLKIFCEYFFAPFKWMGMNSLLVFCGSTFYYIFLDRNIKFHVEGYADDKISLYRYFFDKIFKNISNGNESLAEMLLALFAGFLFMLIAFIFYRKRWFIKL